LRKLAGKILILFIPLCLLPLNILNASENTPPWILFQRGMHFYDQRNFGEAFRYFRQVTARAEHPEAEYWIGRIFENEGQNTLALRQFERALDIAYRATSDEFHIAVLLSVARIYERQERHDLYEITLLRIINDVKRAVRADMEYERVLGDRLISLGLDRVIFYFRYELDSLITPYGDLGVFYFKSARDRDAIRQLASASVIILSRLIEANRGYNPHYEYTNVRSLILSSERNDRMREYMIESGLYRYLFFLALSLDNIGEIRQANYILGFLAESVVRNNYNDISLRIRNNNFSARDKDGVKRALLFNRGN